MDAPRRPSLCDRPFSTPPITPTAQTPALNTSKGPILGDVTNLRVSSLTPPISPWQKQSSGLHPAGLSLSVANGHRVPPVHRDDTPPDEQEVLKPVASARPAVLECPFEVEISRDQCGQMQIYGAGAWSTVFRGYVRNKDVRNDSYLTPPSSPVITVTQLVAVKQPLRRDAIPIVKSEAVILSQLAATDDSDSHIVPFYGIIFDSDSLILAAMPLSLETHIRRCAVEAQARKTTWTMSEPVVGNSKTWLHLASLLIEGLAWLHTTARVVHGDIKPGNLLLSPVRDPTSVLSFVPLFADFSSGQLLDSDTITPNTLSAVTREYTAPELLSYAVLSNPKSAATRASDVFSLAVTLLVAATGELMVYGGSAWQRQAMATQGWYVLSNVRSGDQGAKVPKHGIVEQVLERAVLKAGMGRIDASAWLALVHDKMKGGPEKKV